MTLRSRWRQILGRYAEPRLGESLDAQAAARDDALEFLYGREYQGRGQRDRGPGGLQDSQPRLVEWLGQVRELFPRETIEVIEKHALDRYGLTDLVRDPETLARLEPNQQLLRTLLALRGHLQGEVLVLARRIIRQVVEELRRRLEPELRRTLCGRINRQRSSPLAMAQNFDARGTVRRNLRHYDPERARMLIESARFFERNSRRLPWEVWLCIDQSGSMVDSVIHSAVMAGILAALPAFRVRVVVFDTQIVDLSEFADDPVEMLLRVQLGGGTEIAKALRYCAEHIENPQRTVLVLVSDFCEGGPPSDLFRVVKQLLADRVKLIGLAALDEQAQAAHDERIAGQLVALGMPIAALTPRQLADWLVQVVS